MALIDPKSYYYFTHEDNYFLLDINNSYWYHVNLHVIKTVELASKVNTVEELKEVLSNEYDNVEAIELAEELAALLNEGQFSTESQLTMSLDERINIKHATLHISNTCNLSCTYCFGDKGTYGKDAGLMSKEMGQKCIDFMCNNFSGDEYSVSFFGGEPMMNFETMKEIIEYAETTDKKFSFGFTTNGTIFDQKLAEYLKEKKMNILLSLDGDKETHDHYRKTKNGLGSYDKIMGFLGLLQHNELPIPTIRLTFTKDNLRLRELVQHVENLGVKSLAISPVSADTDCEWKIDLEDLKYLDVELEDLYKQFRLALIEGRAFILGDLIKWLNKILYYNKREFPCGMGTNSVAFSAYGEIYPCHRLVGRDKFMIGTLDQGINIKRLREIVANTVDTRIECRDCWARYFCSGGCLQESAQDDGSIGLPNPIYCHLAKKHIHECVKLYSFLLAERQDILERITKENKVKPSEDC